MLSSWRGCAPVHKLTAHHPPTLWPQWCLSCGPGWTCPLSCRRACWWRCRRTTSRWRRCRSTSAKRTSSPRWSNQPMHVLSDLIAGGRWSSLCTKWPGRLARPETSQPGCRMESRCLLYLSLALWSSLDHHHQNGHDNKHHEKHEKLCFQCLSENLICHWQPKVFWYPPIKLVGSMDKAKT